jgi:squalene-hopene/tetraprenyl-beta-curcumene cyclase
MLTRIAVVALAAMPAFCGDWNPKLAAQYLDAREKAWFAWPQAQRSGVVCISCHTSVPYLIARPALRRALGENGPTLYEAVLLDGVKATVVKSDAKTLFGDLKGLLAEQVFGAQTVLSAFVLAMDEARRPALSLEAEKAFERMWSIQVRDGKYKGAWNWSDFDLDPWETPESTYYGAALAAVATGVAPGGYQARPEIQANIAAMRGYLRGAQAATTLHNRLVMLWASAKLRDLVPDAERQAIIDEAWRKQQADGGWTLESLGAWKKRPEAPPAHGSNSYATGLAAFALEQAGARGAGLGRAIAWLKAHQDSESGFWAADSMNHRHEAGSMTELFMRDAATSFATLALLDAEQTQAH